MSESPRMIWQRATTSVFGKLETQFLTGNLQADSGGDVGVSSSVLDTMPSRKGCKVEVDISVTTRPAIEWLRTIFGQSLPLTHTIIAGKGKFHTLGWKLTPELPLHPMTFDVNDTVIRFGQTRDETIACVEFTRKQGSEGWERQGLGTCSAIYLMNLKGQNSESAQSPRDGWALRFKYEGEVFFDLNRA